MAPLLIATLGRLSVDKLAYTFVAVLVASLLPSLSPVSATLYINNAAALQQYNLQSIVINLLISAASAPRRITSGGSIKDESVATASFFNKNSSIYQ